MTNLPIEEFYDLIDKRVGKFGWTSVFVPPSADVPCYAYTVGFSEIGKHDFLIIGEDHGLVCFIFYRLWEMTDQDYINGPGMVHNVIQHIDVDLVAMNEDRAKDFAVVAVRRLGKKKLRMLQVVMPDPSDKLSSGLSLEEENEMSAFVHHGPTS